MTEATKACECGESFDSKRPYHVEAKRWICPECGRSNDLPGPTQQSPEIDFNRLQRSPMNSHKESREYMSVAGIAPDFTDGKESAEYIKRRWDKPASPIQQGSEEPIDWLRGLLAGSDYAAMTERAEKAEERVKELEDLLLGVFEITGHTHDWRCDSGCALSAAQWKGAAIKFAREEAEARAILSRRSKEESRD